MADDHDDTRDIIGEALWVAGYRVELAVDGADAMARVEATPPDLLLLDLRMPRLSGVGVLRALRERPATRDLPVIAFTAWGENEATAEAERLGCRRVIAKPADPRLLVQAVNDIVASPAPRDPAASPWLGGAGARTAATRALAAAVDELEERCRRWRSPSLHTPPSVLARRLMASAAAHGMTAVSTRARELATILDALEDTWDPSRAVLIAIAVAELRTALDEAASGEREGGRA